MAAAVHVLVFEGFEDHAPLLALAEARRRESFDVVTVGFDDWPVRSACGLRVLPDRELSDVAPADVRLLVLPDGELWEEERYPRALLGALLERLLAARVPVAAVGGATLALARAGLLAGRAHTSGAREFLPWHVPEYGGGHRYVDAPVVRDRGVLTARADAHAELARAVAEELGAAEARAWAARRAAGGGLAVVGGRARAAVAEGRRAASPNDGRAGGAPWRGRADA